MNITRVIDILKHQAKNMPLDVALAQKIDGKWKTYSTADVVRHVDKLSLGLLELGIKPGDKVAIISFNRPEWNFVDFAIQQIGAISVPMYPNITVEDYSYIFHDADVKAVFVQNEDLGNKVLEATADLAPMLGVYSFDKSNSFSSWTAVQELGKNRDLNELQPLIDAIKPEDLFTLIYTSGTTGNPKGVMLSNNNIVSNVVACQKLVPATKGDRTLSFLPLCHVFERMLVNLYMHTGLSVYYAESMETIADNLKEVKPQIFTTVPRLLEKVYDKIMAKGADLSGIKKALFYWAVGLGQRYDINKSQGFFYDFKLKIANKIIFSKWREALGGNINAVVSGSAPLQPRLATIFWAAQIPVMEGYGLTESSPVISVNEVSATYNRIGTVGRIIDGVEVKIAEDGEILVKGPNVMMGYYQNPEATAKEISADGWLHTGDIGEFVEKEYLKITDRKKQMFKTSGGKYVAPSLVENKIKESILVEQVMVVGEGKKFPGALIIPNFEALKSYCDFKKIPFLSEKEVIEHPAVLDKFERDIMKLNKSFAQWEQVKQFKLIATAWTIEGGELTPTMKCKRKVILEKYKTEIESIYQMTKKT